MDAFRRLRSGSTIGKVVIRLQGVQDDIGTAVITGGLGGLRLVAAETLVDLGANRVAKRTGEGHRRARLTRLPDLGSGRLVSVEGCNVSDKASFAFTNNKLKESLLTFLVRTRQIHWQGCLVSATEGWCPWSVATCQPEKQSNFECSVTGGVIFIPFLEF